MLAYLFNPLVVLVSAMWMFDAIPLLFLVGAIYCVRRDKPVFARVSLGLGAAFKFFPLLTVPAFAVYYMNREGHKWLHLVAGFLATFGVIVAPFYPEILEIVSFHLSRPGGGLTLHSLHQLVPFFTDSDTLWILHDFSPTLGSVTTILGLTAVTIWIHRSDMALYSATFLVLVVFFLSTQHVKAYYPMWLVPLFLLVLYHFGSPRLRFLFYGVTVLPILMAMLRGPLLVAFHPIIQEETIASWYGSKALDPVIVAIALAFVALLVAIVADHTKITHAQSAEPEPSEPTWRTD